MSDQLDDLAERLLTEFAGNESWAPTKAKLQSAIHEAVAAEREEIIQDVSKFLWLHDLHKQKIAQAIRARSKTT